MNCYEATTVMKFLRHIHQNKRNELLKLQLDQNFLKEMKKHQTTRNNCCKMQK